MATLTHFAARDVETVAASRNPTSRPTGHWALSSAR